MWIRKEGVHPREGVMGDRPQGGLLMQRYAAEYLAGWGIWKSYWWLPSLRAGIALRTSHVRYCWRFASAGWSWCLSIVCREAVLIRIPQAHSLWKQITETFLWWAVVCTLRLSNGAGGNPIRCCVCRNTSVWGKQFTVGGSTLGARRDYLVVFTQRYFLDFARFEFGNWLFERHQSAHRGNNRWSIPDQTYTGISGCVFSKYWAS